MKKLVMADECAMIAYTLRKSFKTRSLQKKKSVSRKIYFCADENFLCDYLLKATAELNERFKVYDKIIYVSQGNDDFYRKETLLESGCETVDINALEKIDGEAEVFFFADCIKGFSDREKTSNALKTVLEKIRSNGKAKCILSVFLPKINEFPGEVTALSEREYNFFIEKCCEKNSETQFYISLEKICREEVRENNTNVSLLRFDNVFAPDKFHTPSIDFEGIINEVYSAKKAVITDEDCKKETSVTYVRNACYAVYNSMLKAKKGHVYNIAFNNITVALLKETIFKNYSSSVSVQMNVSSGIEKSYNKLNQLVFSKLGIKSVCSLETGIKHAYSYITGEEYDTSSNTSFYCGKIKTIQQLEIEILKVIDDICVKHGIKYFLAGGTLLGAVRAGEAIPWDDDLDIGMLREDYEKFRKVCEKELPDGFSFSSPFNGSGSHYTIEKIRLNGTYFSTNYSSENIFPDGVFVDVLVYDQTSNNGFLRKMQGLILAVMYDCLIVKWFGRPRKNFHYRITKTLLPILKIIPYGVFHGIFEFFVKIFMNKKDATLLIDSVGKKLKDGPLPKKGLEDTVYVDFEGIKAPIPVDVTGYLNYAYGPTYMQMPVLSKRSCPHNFARIDLGKYVFDVKGETKFRDVDLRGELYESEDEV